MMGQTIRLMVVMMLMVAVGAGGVDTAAQNQTQRSVAQSGVSSNQQRAAAGETLIRNATVLTIARGTLPNTDVLLRDGKIAAVGQNLKAGDMARVIDATGKFVMPGIVDAHSHSMMDAVNELTLSVTSMARIQDVLNPTDVDLYRAL
ncbi:MAG: amidohydrolase family protein, partial [Acidobacteriota bacterium]|nr:amidohydrolase family protein [Acidobacteriota bacterium]